MDTKKIYDQVWDLIKDSLEPGEDHSDVCRAISTAINVTIKEITEDKTEEVPPR